MNPTTLPLPRADLRTWRNRHRDYLYDKVYTGQGGMPETFTALNANAFVTTP